MMRGQIGFWRERLAAVGGHVHHQVAELIGMCGREVQIRTCRVAGRQEGGSFRDNWDTVK